MLSYNKFNAMLMLRVYLDDAGKADDPSESICCIAGCVSPLKAWEALESEWKQALDKFDVPYLHMKELAHFKGPFAKWHGKASIRKDFLASLLDIMGRHIMAPVGTTVPLDAYNSLSDEQKRLVPDPYFMGFQSTLHAAGSVAYAETRTGKTLRKLDVSDPKRMEAIHVLFSHQDDFEGYAAMLFKVMQRTATIGPLLGAFTWASYKTVIPLQAADLVAYEMKHFAGDLLKSDAPLIRVPMQRLLTMRPCFTFLNQNESAKKFYFSGPTFAD